MTDRLTYRKGPLGYAVILDGKPWGRIRDIRNISAIVGNKWQVSVPGLDATTMIAEHGPHQGKTLFPTVKAAKQAIAEHLKKSEG